MFSAQTVGVHDVTSDVVANVFCTDSRCTGHDVRRVDVFCTDSMLQDMSDVPIFSAQTIDVQDVTQNANNSRM